MSSDVRLEVVAAAPWGEGPHELPLVLENVPSFGEMSPEQARKVRAPLRIRLDASGGIHALGDAPLRTPSGGPVFIHHFGADGTSRGKTPLLPAAHRDTEEMVILDYAVDAEGSCYVLEQIRPQQARQPYYRLRKLDRAGEAQWMRTDLTSTFRELEGPFARLLMDGRSRLYLPATEQAGTIAKIDPATGAVVRIYTAEKSSSEVFMNEQGIVLYVLYFPEVNRRGLGAFNLADQQLTSIVGGDELYGWLLYPFGVDAGSRVYVWREASIARIAFDGSIAVLATLDNIVIRPSDRAIFVSRLHAGTGQAVLVEVERHVAHRRAHQRDLHVPGQLSTQLRGSWKLIHVDEQERYYVFGGEEPGRAGTLLVYAADGALEDQISPPPDMLPITSTLESYRFWQVDTQGCIYLPITDAQGFKVVRLVAP